MNKIKLFAVLIFVLSFVQCGKADEPLPDDEDSKPDNSLEYTRPSPTETAYSTFFKPANAETGDPMPFYDEQEKMFYIYFLLGNFSGYSKGGVYLTKTKDFAQFQPVSAQILTGTQSDKDTHIGTGSCIKKDDTYHFFYTGFNDGPNPSIVTKATAGSLSDSWIKVPSLAINAPIGYEKGEFRDPHVYWDDTRNQYVMLVGSRNEGKSAIARFQSEDLIDWVPIKGILSTTSENPGKFEIETDTWIPECPDIFKIGNYWYMSFSRLDRDDHRKTFYRIADNPDGPWRKAEDASGHHETFDGLYMYAAKTVSDGENRYISGWASSGQERQSNGELHWGGMLITHKLTQQPNGKLYPSIPDGVNNKFTKTTVLNAIKKEGQASGEKDKFTLSNRGEVVFNRTAASAKIEMKIDASNAIKSFGIAFGAHEKQSDVFKLSFDLSNNNKYNTPAIFMYHHNKEYNFTPLIVPADKKFYIKVVVERQVCVLYVNDNVAFTNHISNMENNPWMIFSENEKVTFSDIRVFN